MFPTRGKLRPRWPFFWGAGMKWAAVEIEHADEENVAETANALMEILSAVKREKAPSDFEVWK